MYKLHLGSWEQEEALSHPQQQCKGSGENMQNKRKGKSKNTPFLKDLYVKAEDMEEKLSPHFVLWIPQAILPNTFQCQTDGKEWFQWF